MYIAKTFLSATFLLIVAGATAQTKMVDHFSKVIVSPYIQVTFVQGDEESVTINNIKVDSDKLHIEVNNKTLRIYLEGAKEIPKEKKDYSNGYKQTRSLYDNTSVTATVTYKKLNALSLRGEETQLCKSPITTDLFTLKVYGQSTVTFNELDLENLEATLYGESTLEIKSGTVKEQKYTCYGEGKINSLAITGNTGQITAYGEADFNMNVSDQIKIVAFGEAKLHYKGNPEIVKSLHIGELHVDKMD
jgi:hypothetical protein